VFKRFSKKKTSNFKDPLNIEEYIALVQAAKISNLIYNWQKDECFEKISIGQNCNTSWYLKETNNKNASYPFDWIFSSAEIVSHAIKDDFISFLDKESMYPINSSTAGHLVYHSRMFNHKNPLNTNEEYDYYKRCVDRFVSIINSGKPIVFVCTVINEPDKRPSWSNGFDKQIPKPTNQTIKSFLNLMDVLQQINPCSKFLFINQSAGGEIKIECTLFKKDVMWIDFVSKGENTGVKYLNLLDDTIMKIVYNGLNEKRIEKNN
jgi:hypothetical protein